MTTASAGPCRPTPPVGRNTALSCRAAQRNAAATRLRKVALGEPSGSTAAPNIMMMAAGLDMAFSVMAFDVPAATAEHTRGMITIYHLGVSRSERIVWLMEELGLKYHLEKFDRRPDMLAPDALRQIHPLGRAPIIRDGDTVLAESGAIVEYIIARHGEGRLAVAPSQPNFAAYLYWLHYAEGSLLLQLLREWSLERMLPDADAAPGMARVRETTRLHLSVIEARLAEAPYFAGQEFTAADVMMLFPFTTLQRFRTLDLSPYPNILAYIARMEARPAYQLAMALADPQ